MRDAPTVRRANRTIRLFPWFKFCESLVLYQAVWFLFYQSELSAAEAILLYVVYDLSATALEVPSGYMSDRLGRRLTLIIASACGVVAGVMFALGGGFWWFAFANVFLAANVSLYSGTDSAILYESLKDAGREDEVEAQELKAWRYSYSALAISAIGGGVLALFGFEWAFWATAAGFGAALCVTLAMCEPSGKTEQSPGTEWTRIASLKAAFQNPVLLWLLALGMLMYAYSHIPFVFGQPFILEALRGVGLAADAPLISGAVTTIMMLVSISTSLIARQLKDRFGLAWMLVLAFGIQVALAALLAASNSVAAIALLFLRMVPDSLSRPFILARIQPELENDARATYLSLRSLIGRLFFAATLMIAAGGASNVGALSFAEMRWILLGYAGVGVVALVVLVHWVRTVPLDVRTTDPAP